MKRTVLFSLFALLACGSMQASTFNFGYGETNEATTGNGNDPNTTARTYTQGGITVTVTAFTLLNGSYLAADTTQFNTAQNANNNLGIGVCSTMEIAATNGCTFNEWQMDDKAPGGADFLLFTFSQAVDISNLVIHQTTASADSDAAYWSSNTVAPNPLSSWALTSSPGGTLNPGSSRTIIPTPNGINGVRTFFIGAMDSGDGNPDYFKLVSLDVKASAAPEPGTMVLLGTGLVALGAFSRRKKA